LYHVVGLREIYRFEDRNTEDNPNPLSIMELRTLLDWEVARRLKSAPGAVEVNPLGGELKTYEVELDPNRLLARGISLNQVYEAVRRNNVNAGGGYIQHNGELRGIPPTYSKPSWRMHS
jgi:cobalt-zinc-cadmium resistance protein CzcA